MIRHIVLWKLKETITADEEVLRKTVDQIFENHRRMKENAPQILRMELCRSVRSGADIYEFGAIMDFASVESLLEFRASDAHTDPVAMAFCHCVRERKATIDFEVPGLVL